MEETFKMKKFFLAKLVVASVVLIFMGIVFIIFGAGAKLPFVCVIGAVCVVIGILAFLGFLKYKSFSITITENGISVSGGPIIPWASIEKVQEETIPSKGRWQHRLLVSYVDKDKGKGRIVIHEGIEGYDFIKDALAQA